MPSKEVASRQIIAYCMKRDRALSVGWESDDGEFVATSAV